MKLEELDYKYTTYSVCITRSTNSDHIKKDQWFKWCVDMPY